MTFSEIQLEIILRSSQDWEDTGDVKRELNWIKRLRQVSTAEAFALAEKGEEVVQIYADGTDSVLDDLETEREYYPDITKNYPEIDTIFVVEDL